MKRDTCEKLLTAYKMAVKSYEKEITKALSEVIVDIMSDGGCTFGTTTNPFVIKPGQPYDDFGHWTVTCTGVDELSDVMRCESQ